MTAKTVLTAAMAALTVLLVALALIGCDDDDDSGGNNAADDDTYLSDDDNNDNNDNDDNDNDNDDNNDDDDDTTPSGDWRRVTIDEGDVGMRPAIGVDGQNAAHIIWEVYVVDETRVELKHATNETGVWTTEVVDSNATGGMPFCSNLAVDSNGDVHVPTIGRSGAGWAVDEKVRYFFQIEGDWREEILGDVADSCLSIALDSDDKPWIAFSSPETESLLLTKKGVDGWANQEVLARAGARPRALSVDAANKASLLVYDYDSEFDRKEIKFLSDSTGGWATTLVYSFQGEELWLSGVSMAVAPIGVSHVLFSLYGSFYEYPPSPLVHMSSADNFAAEEVVTERTSDPAAACDEDGNLHIVFFKEGATEYSLWYTTNRTGTWESELIDDREGMMLPSIAIDGDGYTHAAYGCGAVGENAICYATNRPAE